MNSTAEEAVPDPRFVFKPIILDPSIRWRSQPYDLRFDARWTHQAGCVVSMDAAEEITVRVDDRSAAHLSGMRFSTGGLWVDYACGQDVRIHFTTRSVQDEAVPYQVVYLPQDSPRSEFFQSSATPTETTFTFDFVMPESSESITHLIVFEPLVDDAEIVISRAFMELDPS